MRRRAYRFAVAASAVLAVAVAGAWVRGLWVVDQFDLQRSHWADLAHSESLWVAVFVTDGSLQLLVTSSQKWITLPDGVDVAATRGRYPPRTSFRHQSKPAARRGVLGYARWERDLTKAPGIDSRTLEVAVPIWWLQVATLVLPCAALLRRIRRARRQTRGLCRACGYDLRASPERCPECGVAVAGAGEAAAAGGGR